MTSHAAGAPAGVVVFRHAAVSARASACPADPAGRPRPLEVEAAKPSVHVEDLPHQIEAGLAARLHRRRVDLVERNAAGRDFGKGVAAAVARRRAANRQARAQAAADPRASGAPSSTSRSRPARGQPGPGDRVRQPSCRARWPPAPSDAPRPRRAASVRSISKVSPGSTESRTSIGAGARVPGCASSLARCQCRDRLSTTGPLTPKCVHSSGPSSRIAVRPPARKRQRGRMRHAGQRPMPVAAQHERRERRRRRHAAVPEARRPANSRSRRCRSWAATVRRSPAPPPARSSGGAPARSTSKPAAAGVAARSRGSRSRSITPRRRASSSSASSTVCARFVSGKSLPCSSSCSATPSSSKNCDRPLGGKRPQHARDQPRRAAPEVALGHDAVGDVAARAAAHEDLGADVARAVQAAHAERRRRARREDRRREAGRAGTDHDDVSGSWMAQGSGLRAQASLSRVAPCLEP